LAGEIAERMCHLQPTADAVLRVPTQRIPKPKPALEGRSLKVLRSEFANGLGGGPGRFLACCF